MKQTCGKEKKKTTRGNQPQTGKDKVKTEARAIGCFWKLQVYEGCIYLCSVRQKSNVWSKGN